MLDSTLQAPEAGHQRNERSLAIRPRRVSIPTYDRRALRSSIVHFGVGGFHRAHQAVYLDELAERRVSLDWGVIGVGLRSPAMKRALMPQDWMYTVVERGSTREQARMVGAISECLYGPEDARRILAALTAPETKLVTLTVTGDGYKFDLEAEALCEDDPHLLRDLRRPDEPATLHGFIVAALRERRARGIAPFSVLSCDNVPSNGRVAREAVVSFARMSDDALADWIDANVAFPATVVDRITPQTTPRDREMVARRFGVRDRWPVVAESYSQWIIEDCFSGERPPLEEVGAEFVADASPYELVKKRMLNGAHCAIAYLAHLRGHRRIDQAMADRKLRSFIADLLAEEIIPQLTRPPGVDLHEYKETLLERFSNPHIGDQISRLAARGSTKMPAYLLPSLKQAVREDLPRERLTLALAGWVRCLQGMESEGRGNGLTDDLADTLRPLARKAAEDPRPLLAREDIFGDLARDPGFPAELRRALAKLGPALRWPAQQASAVAA